MLFVGRRFEVTFPASVETVHLAQKLVVGFYAQGIIVILSVFNSQQFKHVLLIFIANHVANDLTFQLLGGNGIVTIQQHIPPCIAHDGTPFPIFHDKAAHLKDDGRVIIFFVGKVVWLYNMILSCRKVSAHASFALIGFYAVVEQVEPDFVNLGNTVDSDRGTMRHAQGYHGTCTLVSGSQNTVISIHNDRFDDSESTDTLLQFQEFIFGQFPGGCSQPVSRPR